MHHIHTTDAFILKNADTREADKRYAIFSREMGLIYGSARGVRLLRSKLRYSLRDFSLSSISLVKGKDVWRLTNARIKNDVYTLYQSRPDALHMIGRIFRLLVRLLPEGEPQRELFDDCVGALSFMEDRVLSLDALGTLECILAMRILRALGYLADQPGFSRFLSSPWSSSLLAEAEDEKQSMILTINESLHHSHL